MSLCEISLDFNAIDVAFSKSGSKIAVLTSDGVTLYSWELKTISSLNLKLENVLPFSQSSERGRQIAFLGESDLYILKQRDFSIGEIEKVDLVSGERTPVFEPMNEERLSSIFSSIGQDALWISQGICQKKGLLYSVLSIDNGIPSVNPWVESPGQETSWALATQPVNGHVGSPVPLFCCFLLTAIRVFYFPSPGRVLSMPTKGFSRRIAPHSHSLLLTLSSQQPSIC